MVRGPGSNVSSALWTVLIALSAVCSIAVGVLWVRGLAGPYLIMRDRLLVTQEHGIVTETSAVGAMAELARDASDPIRKVTSRFWAVEIGRNGILLGFQNTSYMINGLLSEGYCWDYPEIAFGTQGASPPYAPTVGDLRDWRRARDPSASIGHHGFAISIATGVTEGGGIVRQWLFAVPYWSVLMVSLAAPLVYLYGLLRRRSKLSHGCCGRCGYDLRGSPTRCPECGALKINSKEGICTPSNSTPC